MAIGFDTKKGAEKLSNFLQKTTEVGKNAAESVQKGAAALSEKVKEDSYQWRLKKYNPLFPEEYQSEAFCLPNMIVIVDDAVRRGIDICEGSIGWRSNQNGTEVLHLYDEAVPMSGIQFVPSVTCDAVYYVDSFDRKRYIRTDCIFSQAHEERLAELKNVAYMLGAKSCSIEIVESAHQANTQTKSLFTTETLNAKNSQLSSSENAEQSSALLSNNQLSGITTVTFEGSNTPQRPELKWFSHAENIKKLIEMRCSGDNAPKSDTLEILGSSSSTMSQKTACAIDSAIGKIGGFKGNLSMEGKAIAESTSKLYFHIEF